MKYPSGHSFSVEIEKYIERGIDERLSDFVYSVSPCFDLCKRDDIDALSFIPLFFLYNFDFSEGEKILSGMLSRIDDIDVLRVIYLSFKRAANEVFLKEGFRENIISKYFKIASEWFDKKISMLADAVDISMAKKKVDEISKIVIVTGFVIDKPGNSHLTILKNAARVILNINPSAEIYFALTGEKTVRTFFGWEWLGRRTDVFKDAWFEMSGQNGLVYQSLDIHSSQYKIRDFIEWVGSINPDLFIMHGNVTEATYSMRILSNIYPVLYYPSSVRNIPTAPVSSILVRGEEMKERIVEKYVSRLTYKPILKVMDLPYLYEDFKNRKNDAEDVFSSVVMASIVIGRNQVSQYFSGLEKEDVESFFNLFLDDGVGLTIVGDAGFSELFKAHAIICRLVESGNVKLVERISEEHIYDFLSTVSFTFSLPGVTGGGGALTKSVVVGTPVISAFDNDGVINCGEFFTYRDHNGMIDLMRQMLSTPDLRRQCLIENQEKLKKRVGSKLQREFYDLVEKTFMSKHNSNY